MKPPAIGPKTKMMEQKVFLKLWKMFSGSTMTLNIHGINAGSMEDKPDEAKVKAREKEKEKAEVAEDFSNQEDSKAEAKAEEKAALTWWEKKGMMMNGKMKMNGMIMKVFGQKSWNDAYGGTEELYYTVRLLLNKMINKKEKLWYQVMTGKLMDYAENSSDITETEEDFYMTWKELRLQFQRNIFWMKERLTWTLRRARRRFFTRTTGVRRGRGFLTRWKNSGRAKRSTRSRTTTRSFMVFRSLTLIVPTEFPEET